MLENSVIQVPVAKRSQNKADCLIALTRPPDVRERDIRFAPVKNSNSCTSICIIKGEYSIPNTMNPLVIDRISLILH
jgi:hypothetical protein